MKATNIFKRVKHSYNKLKFGPVPAGLGRKSYLNVNIGKI